MTFTKEKLIEQAKKNIEVLRGAVEKIPGASDAAVIHLKLAEIAMASLEAEAVMYASKETLAYAKDGEQLLRTLSSPSGDCVIPLYSAPPAPVVEDIGEISVGRLPTMNQDDYPGLGDWWVQLRTGKDSDEVLGRVYGATPQEANSRAEALACRAAMLQGAEHVIDVEALSALIEGMEVSVDVSTCDADAGHRYFGTVTEISELDGAKNGYILLVQDAEPNFVPTGNSPAIPDGWVMVPADPTAEMLQSGISAHYERSQIQIHDRPAPGPMTCAYVAMLAAAPQQEVKS